MPRKKPTRHTIAVDWDGTCVPAVWPDAPTEWMPGALRSLRRLSEDHEVIIWTSRISPYNPITGAARSAAEIQEQIQYIRDMLDEAGLTQIGVWTHPWKPGADVYIDDKAERYHGRPGSWDAVTEKVLLRFEGKSPTLPPIGEVGPDVLEAYIESLKEGEPV